METIEKSAEVLNDLIQINNDRVNGFEKVIADLTDSDSDLKALFLEYAGDSRKNSEELTAIVSRTSQTADTGTSISGSIHRAWIDIKAVFTGKDRKSLLDECERGEDAIKKAYQSAMSEGELSGETFSIIAAQAQTIKIAHDRIKALRDSAV